MAAPRSAAGAKWASPPAHCRAANRASTYLGKEQADWLDDRLAEADTSWTVLLQQTTFGPTEQDRISGGWRAPDRDGVLSAVAASESDLVVLTGDIHHFHALDVVTDPTAHDADPTTGTGAVEFSVGSITSPGGPAIYPGSQMVWNAGFHQGYAVLSLTEHEARCDCWGFGSEHVADEQRPAERWLAGYAAKRGAPYLTEVEEPSN